MQLICLRIDDEITTNEFEDVISEEYLDEYDDEDAPLKKDPSFFNRRRNTKPPNCGTKNLISRFSINKYYV